MPKSFLYLTFVAAFMTGCTRSTEMASTDDAANGSVDETVAVVPAETPVAFYSVDDYDPTRDADADLAMTLEQAQAGKKRIILEVGGKW